jgi:Mor family transcriptional regulator
MSQEPARLEDLPLAQWERGMMEIADALADELRAAGAPMDADLPARLAFRICSQFGGKSWYIPKGANLDLARKHAAIYAAHDGTRHGPHGIIALAEQYGISEIALYRILARQRELRRKRIQSELSL